MSQPDSDRIGASVLDLRRARSLATRGLGLAVLAYGVATLMAAGFVDRLIFFPPAPSYDEGTQGLVRLESATGAELAAFPLKSPGPAPPSLRTDSWQTGVSPASRGAFGRGAGPRDPFEVR